MAHQGVDLVPIRRDIFALMPVRWPAAREIATKAFLPFVHPNGWRTHAQFSRQPSVKFPVACRHVDLPSFLVILNPSKQYGRRWHAWRGADLLDLIPMEHPLADLDDNLSVV